MVEIVASLKVPLYFSRAAVPLISPWNDRWSENVQESPSSQPYFSPRPTWPWSPPQAPWCLPWSSRATCPSNRTPRKKYKVLVSKHFPPSTSLWKFVNILFSVPWMKFSTLFCSPHLKAEQMCYQGLFDHRVMESTKEDNNTKACLICFAISHHLNCTVTSL